MISEEASGRVARGIEIPNARTVRCRCRFKISVDEMKDFLTDEKRVGIWPIYGRLLIKLSLSVHLF